MNSLRQYIPKISLNRFKYTKVSTKNMSEEEESEKKDKPNKKKEKVKSEEDEDKDKTIEELNRNVFLL